MQSESGRLQGHGRDLLWFGLLVLVTASFWGLTWNTQPYLSSDDMGKDLYPFEMTLRGQRPCGDYYWQYGPLMLFYYAFWLQVGGIHLLSIRAGYSLLYFLASILSYRTLRLFVSPPIACIASLSFLIQGMVYPYYNFNHIGTLPFLLGSVLSLWKYFSERKIRWCYLGTLALVGMALIKWNVAAASSLVFLGSLLLFERFSRKGHFLLLALIFGVTVTGVYVIQHWGLPERWVRQCLTVNIRPLSPWVTFKHLIQWFLVWDRKRLAWLVLFSVFGILGYLGYRKKGWNEDEKKVLPWILGSLFSLLLINTHDYFIVGHIYRFDFWSFPFLVLGMGLAAEWAKFLFARKVRIVLGAFVFAGVLALPIQAVREAFAARVPERYLDFPRGRVYLVKESLSSLEAIKRGTRFIMENTRPDQEILTLPIEPLYCFLSGRRHATRELLFSVWRKEDSLGPEEQLEFIQQLEAKQVPLVLLSNRDESNPATVKGEIGYLGKTHLRIFGKYLFGHYEEVGTFGTWEAEKPRIHHAIKVLRRKS